MIDRSLLIANNLIVLGKVADISCQKEQIRGMMF